MYGKIFETTFTGSMMGAGADVFAVWSYALANRESHDRDKIGIVELNPPHVSALIGMTPERVVTAIEFLTAPDPYSRSPEEDGRRLVHEGAFSYRIVNYAKYAEIRNREERRIQNAEAQRRRREKMMTVSRCQQPSASISTDKRRQPTETETETETEHIYLGDQKFKELWISFVEMRKASRAKPTAKAVELLMKKLHAQPLAVACEMLEQSIENNWRGVFPPKGRGDGKRKSVVEEWAAGKGVDLNGGVREGAPDRRGALPEPKAVKRSA